MQDGMVRLSIAATDSVDPITALITRDYAAFGGWSLFIGLCLFVVIGSFREWWVPGARYRRLEDSAAKNSEALVNTSSALEKQVQANEITKYFFEQTIPNKGEKTST